MPRISSASCGSLSRPLPPPKGLPSLGWKRTPGRALPRGPWGTTARATVLRWLDAGAGVYLSAVQQIFVRDTEGKVYGPLEPVTVELLIDGGVLNGALLVSTDGVRYGSPARYPTLKDYFPRHLWADDG